MITYVVISRKCMMSLMISDWVAQVGGRVVARKWGTVPKKLRREGKGVTKSHPKVKLLDEARTSKQL